MSFQLCNDFRLSNLIYLFVCFFTKLKQELFRTFYIYMTFLPGSTLLSCAIQYLGHVFWIVSAHPDPFLLLSKCLNLFVVLIYIIFSERPDIKSQYSSLLYQLLLDPSDRVCFEAIQCVLGKVDNSERYLGYGGLEET